PVDGRNRHQQALDLQVCCVHGFLLGFPINVAPCRSDASSQNSCASGEPYPRVRLPLIRFWNASKKGAIPPPERHQSSEDSFMPAYRSRTTTHGRNMAGARGLWRATGMKDSAFGKPIIAVVNSFPQFVPGHVHLKDMGQLVAREIEAAGGVAKEFNTIAVDDGIAMGHDGMLYSLP